MRQPPLDLDAADEAPVADMLTPYDQEHLVTYIRLLDAELARADWKEAARAILHIDPDREPARARLSWESEPCAACVLDDEAGVSALAPALSAALTLDSTQKKNREAYGVTAAGNLRPAPSALFMPETGGARMEQTLQDRIRERAYHLWKNGDGQRDDNHYWLIAEREVLAEDAAESPLASPSSETAQPAQSMPPKMATPRKARASTRSSSKATSNKAAPTSPAKASRPGFAKSPIEPPTNSESRTQAKPTLAAPAKTRTVPQAVDDR